LPEEHSNILQWQTNDFFTTFALTENGLIKCRRHEWKFERKSLSNNESLSKLSKLSELSLLGQEGKYGSMQRMLQ